MKNESSEEIRKQENFGEWFFRVWTNFPLKLLGINLLFLLFCIPVVTIPAALCGLHAAVQYYYRELYYTSALRTFVTAFLESFWKKTILTLGLFAIPVGIISALQNVLPGAIWIVLAAFVAAAIIVVLNWFVSQLVFLNLTPGQALRNSLIFLCIETKRNFALIALHAVVLTVFVFGLPVTGFLLLFLPVLQTVITTGIVMPTLREKLEIIE